MLNSLQPFWSKDRWNWLPLPRSNSHDIESEFIKNILGQLRIVKEGRCDDRREEGCQEWAMQSAKVKKLE
jgi:hypothetical protein